VIALSIAATGARRTGASLDEAMPRQPARRVTQVAMYGSAALIRSLDQLQRSVTPTRRSRKRDVWRRYVADKNVYTDDVCDGELARWIRRLASKGVIAADCCQSGCSAPCARFGWDDAGNGQDGDRHGLRCRQAARHHVTNSRRSRNTHASVSVSVSGCVRYC